MGRRRPEVTRGFTLLELIVTLAVLAVAIAVVTPAIGRGTEGLRARAEVASFAATLRHAREQAISTQQTYRVTVDTDARRISVVSVPNPANTITSRRPTHDTQQDRAKDRDFVEARTFSQNLVVESMQAPEVVFDPRGAASGGEFKLTSGGIVYHITIDRLTGRVRSTRE